MKIIGYRIILSEEQYQELLNKWLYANTLSGVDAGFLLGKAEAIRLEDTEEDGK